MAIEEGVVVRIGAQGPATAWVKTSRSSACEHCASRDSCNPGAGGESQEVEAINLAGAKVGDQIQLVIATGAMLKATFLLYLFPILCMIAGGFLGDRMATGLGLHPSVASAIVAFIFFGFALVVIRIKGRRMAHKEAYQPKIRRILRNGALHPTDTEATGCPSQTPNT